MAFVMGPGFGPAFPGLPIVQPSIEETGITPRTTSHKNSSSAMQRSARVIRSSTIGTSRSIAKLITVSRSTDSRTPHARGGVESTPSRTANTALRAPEQTSPASFSKIGSSKPRCLASRKANAAFARDAASSACSGNTLFEIARHEEIPAVATLESEHDKPPSPE